MIQSVNRREFEAFGAVFTEKGQLFALPNGHSVALSSAETAIYETVAETWLACEAGIPVLSVLTEKQAQMDFYLDRTVSQYSMVFKTHFSTDSTCFFCGCGQNCCRVENA